MSDNITKRVGLGTAYGFAKAGGYEGTVEEFTELLGNIAIDLARIENLSVTVTTLPAGSQATASLNGSVLSLGIPKGDTGATGATGETGAPAGFGTVSATVDDNIGTPSVEVTASGADTAKNFAFSFHNLKGQKGDKGDTGDVTLSQLEDFTVVQTDENVEPYNFRATPKCGHIERLKKVVGASVAFNQLVSNALGSTIIDGITITKKANGKYDISGTAQANTNIDFNQANMPLRAGGVYAMSGCPAGGSNTTYAFGIGGLMLDFGNGAVFKNTNNYEVGFPALAIKSGVSVNFTDVTPQLTDLTLALGSTIADYVYSLEQATAGSGVAWLKQHFPKMFGQYNAYDAGSIRSVEGVSAHITKDADENVLGSYPLDNSLTLRGTLKIQNGNLYADGDEYEADGSVSRKWGYVVFDGSNDEAWAKYGSGSASAFAMVIDVSNRFEYRTNIDEYLLCDKLKVISPSETWGNFDKWISASSNNSIICGIQSITTVEAWRSYLASNPIVVQYRLAAPTTETADPFTENQICEAGGTEEFVSTSIVPIGHETEYPLTLSDIRPTANGNYVLKCTVSNGKASYEWVSA